MKMIRTTLLLAAACLVTGCSIRTVHHTHTHPTSTPMPTTCVAEDSPDNFALRLAAARSIASMSDRDQAFAQIALDAAAANRPDIVRAGVTGISSFSVRDQTASDASAKLAAAGSGEAALGIASLISSFHVRDEAFKRIATGR